MSLTRPASRCQWVRSGRWPFDGLIGDVPSYLAQPHCDGGNEPGDWALTGDLARKDKDGYFWFVGRKDDVISGGYGIGPGEIEDCLAGHSAVAGGCGWQSRCGAREVVKAFVQLREGVLPTPALARELAEYVRMRLSAHEYPREIEFIEELPMTTTGKVRRRDLRELQQRKLDKNTRGKCWPEQPVKHLPKALLETLT